MVYAPDRKTDRILTTKTSLQKLMLELKVLDDIVV